MNILAPIDGSDCSFRALTFATEFATRYDGTLDVVHFATIESPSTEAILDRATEILEDEANSVDPEVVTDLEASDPRYGNQIGKDILKLVQERGYDHVVMGHHGSGVIDRIILGSAARSVIEATSVPSTIIP